MAASIWCRKNAGDEFFYRRLCHMCALVMKKTWLQSWCDRSLRGARRYLILDWSRSAEPPSFSTFSSTIRRETESDGWRCRRDSSTVDPSPVQYPRRRRLWWGAAVSCPCSILVCTGSSTKTHTIPKTSKHYTEEKREKKKKMMAYCSRFFWSCGELVQPILPLVWWLPFQGRPQKGNVFRALAILVMMWTLWRLVHFLYRKPTVWLSGWRCGFFEQKFLFSKKTRKLSTRFPSFFQASVFPPPK